jgi:hypothetical protein
MKDFLSKMEDAYGQEARTELALSFLHDHVPAWFTGWTLDPARAAEVSALGRLFNWWRVFDVEHQTMLESAEIQRALYVLSSYWPTCACGQQCSVLARDGGGAPLDRSLQTLGYLFSGMVRLKAWPQAREVMRLIEWNTERALIEREVAIAAGIA